MPQNATDITAAAQRIFDKLKGQPGRKVVFIIWAGNLAVPFKMLDLEPQRWTRRATSWPCLPTTTPSDATA